MIQKNITVVPLILILLLLPSASSLFSTEYPAENDIISRSSDCLECHDVMVHSLSESAHELFSGDSGIPIKVGCVSCHDGWEQHMDDPSIDNITNPGNLSAEKQNEICSFCHSSQHQSSMNSTDPHGISGIKCLDCHVVHNNKNNMLLNKDRHEFCISCHADVAADFKKRTAHPYDSGNIDCVDCHVMGEMSRMDNSVGLNWTCQNCHAEFSGPFVHEHPVSSTHLVDGASCLECHQPHGSVNERLLTQPGNGTCFQCHSTPPGHFTGHGGLGAKLSCLECHTEIHGSQDNSLFLDPDLGAKMFPDCYQSGCHNMLY